MSRFNTYNFSFSQILLPCPPFQSRESEADSAYYTSRGGAVPVRWSAPEALDEHKFSEKSDVWSYGVVLYELWTRAELPYKGFSNQRVWVDVTSGNRLSQPDGCPTEIYKIMLSCWAARPAERPTFATIVGLILELNTDRTISPNSPDTATDSARHTPNPYLDDSASAPPVPAARKSMASSTAPSTYQYSDMDGVDAKRGGSGEAHSKRDTALTAGPVLSAPMYLDLMGSRGNVIDANTRTDEISLAASTASQPETSLADASGETMKTTETRMTENWKRQAELAAHDLVILLSIQDTSL